MTGAPPGAAGPGRAGVERPPGVAEIAGRLRLVLSDLARRMRAADPPGELTPSRLSALSIIAGRGGLRVGELAEHLAISAPTASQVVDALQDQGLIVREHDRSDRRVCRVAASPAGHALLDELSKRATGMLAERIAGLPPDQIAALTGALPALETLAGPHGPRTPD
jgi:DNA-binding MarR family transcriptional regulator